MNHEIPQDIHATEADHISQHVNATRSKVLAATIVAAAGLGVPMTGSAHAAEHMPAAHIHDETAPRNEASPNAKLSMHKDEQGRAMVKYRTSGDEQVSDENVQRLQKRPKSSKRKHRKQYYAHMSNEVVYNAPRFGNIIIPPATSRAPQSEMVQDVPERTILHPERLSVPESVAAVAAKDTTYDSISGCSGSLIYGDNEQPIGQITAYHCIEKRRKENVLVVPSTPWTYVGDTYGQLRPIAESTEYLISGNTHNEDQAIAAFAGHSATEVAARIPQMSEQEIKALKKGDVIYNSGWPEDQPANGKNLKRQTFAMSVLGTKRVKVVGGGEFDVLIAAVPQSPDSAICSFGDSGSAGFVLNENGQKRIVGALSSFNDWGKLYNKDPKVAEEVKQHYEQYYNVSLDGYDAVCGFSYQTPSIEKGGTVLQVAAPAKGGYAPEDDGSGFK